MGQWMTVICHFDHRPVGTLPVEGHVGMSAHAPTDGVWVTSDEDSNLRTMALDLHQEPRSAGKLA